MTEPTTENSQPPVIVNVLASSEGLEENASEPIVEIVEPVSSEPIGDNEEPIARPSDAGSETNSNGESDEVTIARIEAERDITIAALATENGDEAPRELEKELDECRAAISHLTTLVQEIQQTMLTPQEPQEVIPETVATEIVENQPENSETPTENDTTQEYTPVPTVEIGTALSDVNEVVNQDLDKIKPRFIPI